jgi:hypothetical protein
MKNHSLFKPYNSVVKPSKTYCKKYINIYETDLNGSYILWLPKYFYLSVDI